MNSVSTISLVMAEIRVELLQVQATLKRMRAERQNIRELLNLYFSDDDNDVNFDSHYQSFSGPPLFDTDVDPRMNYQSFSGPPLFDTDVDFIEPVASVIIEKSISSMVAEKVVSSVVAEDMDFIGVESISIQKTIANEEFKIRVKVFNLYFQEFFQVELLCGNGGARSLIAELREAKLYPCGQG